MKSMSINEAALAAVLYEVSKEGIDLDKLRMTVSAGLMGNRIYAPAGAIEKVPTVDVVVKGIENAKYYLEVDEA